MMNMIIKIGLCVLVVVILSVIQNLFNIKRTARARQVLLPLLAIIYTIIAIDDAFGNMIWIKIITYFSFSDFWGSVDMVVINVMVMGSFILAKIPLRPIITKLSGFKGFLHNAAGTFYQYDEVYEEWFLIPKWIHFRRFMFAVALGTSVAAGVVLGIQWGVGEDTWAWSYAVPVAAVIVVNEIYNFINGKTKVEFEHSIYGDDADSRKVSNYFRVREVFEQLLPGPLLTAHTGFEFAGKQTPAQLVEQLKLSKDKTDVIVGEYFGIDNRCANADIDCVQATVQMMHRQNVVFFNPFYRDLSQYLILPMTNALLSGKKCIIVTGRLSNCDDIQAWISEILGNYTHMKSLWRVEKLENKEPDCEIGVLAFPQIYDEKVLAVNRPFFKDTDFVLLVEPSIIVNTGQIALSIIAKEIHANGQMPVYCICDRPTDGLVDTISHVFHADITNVVAPPLPRGVYTGMTWDADGDFIRQQLFDKQTRYLGNGLELAAIAVKNQIPHVSWYSETKAPVRDIKWIAGQFHPTICGYMNLPAQQKNLYEKIDFVSNLWTPPSERDKFLVIEDEFCNMFSTMRTYMSRGNVQAFVNVLSENYLLRDYMRHNRKMFTSNPNAIPSLVPDYSKTERNTLIKLLLTMTFRPVTDAEIMAEFLLVGIKTDEPFKTMCEMLHKYTYAEDTIFSVHSVKTMVDELTTMSVSQYTIARDVFEQNFADSLQCAYFILEEEQHNEEYIDAKLFGHVTQLVLPGQFVTYDGKYYQVKHVSPQSGVVLRRASDLYDGRKYYRQIRRYHFDDTTEPVAVSNKTVMDIEVAFIRRDFTVHTTGYLELDDNHNLRLARTVDFSEDPAVDNYVRRYHNKCVLRIKLPETDENIRFTLCLLLSEVFKTTFPDAWQYIACVTKRPENIDGVLNHLVPPITGDVDDDYIYIIEDSDIDLGLTEAIERNFMKLMEIVADYLEWHFEKEQENTKPETEGEEAFQPPIPEREKKEGFFGRMKSRIGSIFKRKPKKPKNPTEETAQDVSATQETTVQEAKNEEISAEANLQVPVTENPQADDVEGAEEAEEANASDAEQETSVDEYATLDGTDIFETQEDEEFEKRLDEAVQKQAEAGGYQKSCFLNFGYDQVDNRLKLDDVHRYLRVRGWTNNSLTMARKREVMAKSLMDLSAVNYCDFCGLPLSGVSYEILNDGRVRCNDCSSSAITTVEEYRRLFYHSLEMMEAIYGVKFRTPISVSMADAKTVAKGFGAVYRPTNGHDPRIVGFARRQMGKYSLMIENGSPRLATLDTMVHEMTHIWQYLNWKDSEVDKLCNMGDKQKRAIANDILYEGMAMWSAIQYLYQIGESYYAAQQDILAESRKDVYGVGYRLYKQHYPLILDSSFVKYSPFAGFPPVDKDALQAAVREFEQLQQQES